jgi:hypothetical protein
MMKNQLKLVLATLILSFGFLYLFYQPIIKNPDAHLFSDQGDGIKNYFSFVYHIKHDTSAVHFEGMNYPYGDLLQFSDGQPLIANSLRNLAEIIPSIENYPVGWLNLLLLLSFCFAAVFIALILYRFRLPLWFAVIISVGIIGLSPQMFRMSGHLSLAYFFSFPAFWWLMLMDDLYKKWYLVMIAGIYNLAILFIHPYLALINASFALAFLFFRHIRNFRKEWLSVLMRWTVIILLPILFWKVYLNVNDDHVQRAEDVFFLTGNTATLSSVITPPFGWLNRLLNQWIKIDIAWEGWAYIGLVSLFFIIWAIVRLFFMKKSERVSGISLTYLAPLRASLWAAVLILIFSFGYPYRLGMEFLVEWFHPLKQIRALGRFAWVFFYVINVVSFVYLWQWLCIPKQRAGRSLILAGLALVLLAEASFYHYDFSKMISSSENVFSNSPDNDWKLIYDENEPKLDSVQAIIAFPYFHIGGSAYSYETEGPNIMKEAFAFSYQSGIPMMNSAMARSSEEEARKNIQFTAFPWIPKEMKADELDKNRQILILSRPGLVISPEESYWIEKAHLIYESSELRLHSLFPKEFYSFDAEKFIGSQNIDSTFTANDFYQSAGDYLLVSKEKMEGTLNKKGVHEGKMNDYNILYEGFEYWFNDKDAFELSFWYNNAVPRAHANTVVIVEVDDQGKEYWTKVANMRNTRSFWGEWSLMRYDFKLRSNTQNVKIFLKSWSRNNENIYWRDILLRKKGTDVSFTLGNTLFYNNHRIPLP